MNRDEKESTVEKAEAVVKQPKQTLTLAEARNLRERMPKRHADELEKLVEELSTARRREIANRANAVKPAMSVRTEAVRQSGEICDFEHHDLKLWFEHEVDKLRVVLEAKRATATANHQQRCADAASAFNAKAANVGKDYMDALQAHDQRAVRVHKALIEQQAEELKAADKALKAMEQEQEKREAIKAKHADKPTEATP